MSFTQHVSIFSTASLMNWKDYFLELRKWYMILDYLHFLNFQMKRQYTKLILNLHWFFDISYKSDVTFDNIMLQYLIFSIVGFSNFDSRLLRLKQIPGLVWLLTHKNSPIFAFSWSFSQIVKGLPFRFSIWCNVDLL